MDRDEAWRRADGGPGGAGAPERGLEAPALVLDHVTAGYGATSVLRDVTLTVPAGGVVALLGPNGAGKTTALRVASGLIRPSAGRVLMEGVDVTARGVHERARLGLCDIPEGRGIFPSLTVRDNLVLQSPHGSEREATAVAIKTFPPLRSRLRQLAGSLSGGEQQMLAICRALVTNPTVVIVDEVSLGLAPIIVDQIFEHLAAIAAQGRALLIVEQYVGKALQLADHVYLLNRGSIVFSGPSAEVRRDSIFEKYFNADLSTM